MLALQEVRKINGEIHSFFPSFILSVVTLHDILLKKLLLSVHGGLKIECSNLFYIEWIISNLVRTKFYMMKVSYV